MSLLQSIQRSMAQRLSRDPYFCGSPPIAVVPKCLPDPIGAMLHALQATGAGVLIMPGKGKFIHTGTPRPATQIIHAIRVIENPAVNRARGGSYETAEDIAWAAASLLWQWIPLDPESSQPMTGGGLVLTDIESGEFRDDDRNFFFAEFTAEVRLQDLTTRQPIRSA